MKALHFGTPARRLFGILHPREPGARPRGGVVLAPPFGHEAIRTHRFYRVLAERLSRAGADVLRFDFFGSGDSAGDDADADLHGWADDLLAAHAQLASLSGAAPAWWLGSRLGGSAALLAHAKLGAAAPSLALWDPVLDGPAYMASLRERHVDALEATFSVPDARWRARLADPTAYLDEAIGFAISPRMREQVAALRPDQLRAAPQARVAMLASPSAAAAVDWLAAQPAPGRLLRLPADFDWTSDDSLNTALVPLEALNALLQLIHDPAA